MFAKKYAFGFFVFLLALTLTSSAAGITPVHAVSFVVNTSADSGTGSLRQAILEANANGAGADTITFAGNYTITLSGQLPAVTTPITIIGNGAANTIVEAAACNPVTDVCSQGWRVFEVTSDGNLTLDSLTVRHGQCVNTVCSQFQQYGGGAYNNGGVLTVTGSVFSNNRASYGGGVYNSNNGALTVTNSAFSGNKASFGGGGYNLTSGTFIASNSVFSGNNADNSGGGIYNFGALTVTNSTFTANNATVFDGGGIYNNSGGLTVMNGTFSGNNASNNGGGIHNNSGTLNLYNAILANSGSGKDCDGAAASGGSANNLIENASHACGLTNGASGNIVGSDPDLGALADNGGPTQTMAPLAGSPAIDAGNDDLCDDNPGPNNLDQRGVARPQGAHCDIGAYEETAQKGTPSFVVNDGGDTDDGSCDFFISAPISKDCTLREAIHAANARSGADAITFANDYIITLTLGSQLPIVTGGSAITITGNGAANTIIQADEHPGHASYRVFEVASGGSLTLDSLTVQNGQCNGLCSTEASNGGSVLNDGALTLTDSAVSNNIGDLGGGVRNNNTLVIHRSVFSGNSANWGGGVSNGNAGAITAADSAFSNNSAGLGGGIHNTGALTATNSTFSDNSATSSGGGIHNTGTLTATNSTFSNNSSANWGGGIYSAATLNLYNTLLANSTNGSGGSREDCYKAGGTVSGDHNLVELDGSGGYACGTSPITGDPNLGPLADNGGSTQTRALKVPSPAIDAGNDTKCSDAGGQDQRGTTRPANVTGSEPAHCDIGAYEANPTQTGPAFTVNANADTDDGSCDVPGSGIGSQDCTLREAIHAANAHSGADTIAFAGDYTITLDGSQLPAVTTQMTIAGNGAANTIVQASACNPATDSCPHDYRVFEVTSAGSLTLDRLTVRHGNVSIGGGAYNAGALTVTEVAFSSNKATTGSGGGVYNTGGTLTATDSVFYGNSALGNGGGIHNSGTLTATNSAFFNNSSSSGYGGGIANNSGRTLTATNSTFFGNSARDGGGIDNAGVLTVTNGTFSDNGATAGSGGGIYNFGTLNLYNTILANSASGSDCYNLSTINGDHNLIEANISCGTPLTTNDPNLAPPADNGGPTQTMALKVASPAIDAGNSANCAAGKDQRGVSYLGTCDIGAYEYDYSGVYYVQQTASGTKDCQSWTNACELQNALASAHDGDEIWAAAGVYKPTTTDADPRKATFQLKGNVAAYGGFSGDETARDQRHSELYEDTILSGDIDDNDSQTPVITNIATAYNNATNSYHVVTGANGATLDGFTITAGCASGSVEPDRRGGGMYNYSSSPTLVNVTFSGNRAAYASGGNGGGVYNYNNNPVLTNATFISNSAYTGGGMNNASSHPTLTNVTFAGNLATLGSGGGMFNDQSSPTVTNVTFSGNSAISGGGMYNYTNSNPVLTNVTFSDNAASGKGGGMYNRDNSDPQIRNTIFWNNTSVEEGSQIYNYGGDCAPTASNSVIEGGYAGGTNIITADPLLGALSDNGGDTETVPLLPGSSAIDAGDDSVSICSGDPADNLDQRGAERPQGAHCDIGAFELVQHIISGNAGVASALLSYTDGAAKTAVAGINGDYSLFVSDDWSGTVTPFRLNYIFVPTGRSYSNVTEEQEYQDYTAIPAYYSLAPNDGWTLESNEFTNAAGSRSSAGTLRVGDDLRNKQYRSLLYFNTASLPDNAVLTRVVLQVRKAGMTGDVFRLGNLIADMKKGPFGLAPLELGDFKAAGAPIRSAGIFRADTSNAGWYQLTLNPLYFQYVNLRGVTQFRLRFELDDDNDRAADYLHFYAGDAANISWRPVLSIEYHAP